MKNATYLFTERFAKLDAEISRLEAERAMLAKFSALLSSHPHLLRDDDRFSVRTATKFELLARVVKYLSSADPYLYGGASTREIYQAVLEDISSDKRATDLFKADPEPPHRGVSDLQRTPLQEQQESLNYNTFRSYLARFRVEGRIFFNENRKCWRLCETDPSDFKHPDEDDIYERE